MEEQTLRYYLKVFSFTLFLILLFLFIYAYNILNKNIELKNNPLSIDKGESLEEIIIKNINNYSLLDINIVKSYLKINNLIKSNLIHYGDFNVPKNSSYLDFINIISKSSNLLTKITIIEGWSQKKLNLELSKYFRDYYPIPYADIIADTYYFEKNSDYNLFIEQIKKNKASYFNKYKNNKLLTNFNQSEIMIIRKRGFRL